MRRALGLAVMVALAGCSTTSVQTEYSPAQRAQIARYRTYAWDATPVTNTSRAQNPIMRDIIVDAVNRQLTAKGYRDVGDGAPDFKVTWGAAIQDRVEVDTMPGYYGYGYGVGGWYGPGFAYGVPVTTIDEYEEGTVIVDVIDAKSNELVWRGVAQSDITTGTDAKERAQKLQDAVRKMFEAFPPPP